METVEIFGIIHKKTAQEILHRFFRKRKRGKIMKFYPFLAESPFGTIRNMPAFLVQNTEKPHPMGETHGMRFCLQEVGMPLSGKT